MHRLMKITFLGAAGGVTGSKHLITTGEKKILLECGMFQGRRREAYEKNKELPFDATDIDAVILSHAHIDHSGLLPLLVKNGFHGPIHMTSGTAAVLEPLLMDAAAIQAEDAAYYRKSHSDDADIMEPLYSGDDVHKMLSLIHTHDREKTFRVADAADVTFYNAGHILGSAQIHLRADGKELFFTGDLGSRGKKILTDPVRAPHADIMVTESTYGGRFHKDRNKTRDELGKIIRDTYARRGKVIIPSFALERTQEVLYDLHRLFDLGKIPQIPVFLDSPLAIAFTEIFAKHTDAFDEETHEFFLSQKKNPFSFSALRFTRKTGDSKRLNARKKPAIIIAGSGMCEGGRVRHHLLHNIEDPRATILIVGYQAEHTLGRKIVEGQKHVTILDQRVKVNARVESLGGYSAHGDQKELVANVVETPGIKKIFIVHGDDEQSKTLGHVLHKVSPDWEITIPKVNKTFLL